MTPFGERLRLLRAERGLQLREMAAALQVSPAYLSALEHGHRGQPAPMLVRQICSVLGIIWDEAEELEHLARLSDPKPAIDTAGLSARHTLAANLLARRLPRMGEAELDRLLALLQAEPG